MLDLKCRITTVTHCSMKTKELNKTEQLV